MAVLRQVRSTDPQVLLEAAASGFLEMHRSLPATSPFPSPDYLLVLRQGGLRDDLIALAAERGAPGWFDPPLTLFQQLPEWLGSTARQPCGDYERVVLLSRLLTQRTTLFGRLSRPAAFVDAIDRLFGELVAEAVEPDALDAALAGRDGRDNFEQNRDAGLAACYRAYLETLAAAGRRDGRDTLVDIARAIRERPAELAGLLGGRREIRILGLQDVRGGWRSLLPALLESPALDAVVLYSTVALEPIPGIPPQTVQSIGPDTDTVPAARVGLLSAPDVDRETEEVARRVRQLIDSGTAPRRVAVISRSARPYVDRMLDALALQGVPATARRRHRFNEIPVVRAVLALFAVAADGWTRHGLVELAEQPYFGRVTERDAPARRLDAIVINHIGYRRRVVGLDAWIEAHRALRDAARDRESRIEAGQEDERRGRATPPPAGRVQDALASFQSFAERARALERRRPLREWVDWLRDFLDNDPWKIEPQLYHVPESRHDIARIDAAGLRGMRQIVAQWNAALDLWGEGEDVIDVVAFESQLREMLSGDAALWTPTRRAVLVTEGLAAAQRSFDHVFLVGMSGDVFPLRSPRSPILDDHDRRHLVSAGLPVETRAVWESRERELFRVLVGGPSRSVTLSWPRSDGKGELAPSAFVEDLVIEVAGEAEWEALLHGEATDLEFTDLPGSVVAAPTLPLIGSADERDFAVHSAHIERVRQAGLVSPYNGRIDDPVLLEWLTTDRLGPDSYTWSATQLEAYAKCPWSWFSQRLLRLDDLDDPDIDMDPLVRGTILHLAMQRFYDSAKEREAGAVFLRETDLDWARPMIRDALARAIAETGSTAWLGAPALRETKQSELERMLIQFVEWEAARNESLVGGRGWKKKRILRTAVDQHELSFGSMWNNAEGDDEILELAGVTFRLRGSIDRVEIGIDDRIDDPSTYLAAVDYKSGKYSTPGGGDRKAWADGVVLQVPLYAHVLERHRPGSRVSRVEYRAIKHREAVHSLELYQIKSGKLVEMPDQRGEMERALESAGRHVARARAGQFPADPAPSCNCPPFCHAWDICRVKGGPSTGR